VHHHIVTDLEVVAERDLDVLKRLEVAAAPLEDVRGEPFMLTPGKRWNSEYAPRYGSG
jgi:hypothetical protein